VEEQVLLRLVVRVPMETTDKFTVGEVVAQGQEAPQPHDQEVAEQQELSLLRNFSDEGAYISD
jgi:hypothetical protein